MYKDVSYKAEPILQRTLGLYPTVGHNLGIGISRFNRLNGVELNLSSIGKVLSRL